MTPGSLFVLERISEPEIEPMDADEMKRNLRMYASSTTRDADVDRYISSARSWVEAYTGRALVDQTWRLTIGNASWKRWPDLSGLPVSNPTSGYYWGSLAWRVQNSVKLRRSPVLAITRVASVDDSGDETVVDPTTYELREQLSRWPSLHMLDGANLSLSTYRIEFRAGYCDQTGSPQEGADVIPGIFKQAMILWAQANYDSEPDSFKTYLDTAERLVMYERVDLGLA